MLKEVESLLNVKIGDKFLVPTNYGFDRNAYLSVVTCESVTPKKCKIGYHTYRKSDGKREGSYYEKVFEYDEVEAETGKRYLRHRFICDFDFNKLSPEKLDAVYKIIKAKEQP